MAKAIQVTYEKGKLYDLTGNMGPGLQNCKHTCNTLIFALRQF